jgi:hypothetical protein
MKEDRILQNRVWMLDRLNQRGCLNCGLCQLCKREPEIVAYLVFKCIYSIRVLKGIKDWLVLINVDITQWNFGEVKVLNTVTYLYTGVCIHVMCQVYVWRCFFLRVT